MGFTFINVAAMHLNPTRRVFASLKNLGRIAFTSLIIISLTLVQNALAGEAGNPLPAKDEQTSSGLFTRSFKVDARRMVDFLNDHPGEKIKAEDQMALAAGMKRLFEAAGVQFDVEAANAPEKGKSMFFNHRTGALMVRATLKDLDVIENILSGVHVTPPQVTIEGKIIRMDRHQGKKAFDWMLGTPLNQGNQSRVAPEDLQTKTTSQGSSAARTSILTASQFQTTRQGLENQKDAEVLAAPKMTTISGRQARISIAETLTEAEKKAGLEESGVTIDMLPTVANDGYSIQLEASITVAEKVPGPTKRSLPTIRKSTIAAPVVVWDGQTAVFRGLGSLPGAKEEKEIYVLLTPTITDPAGNRVHSTDNLPYDPEKVPNQNGK